MKVSEAEAKLKKKIETDKKKKDTENALKHGTFKSPQQPKLDRSKDVREPNAIDSKKLESSNQHKRRVERIEKKNKAYQSAVHQVKGEVAKKLYETTDKKTLDTRRQKARDKGAPNPNSVFIDTKAHDIVNKQFYPETAKKKVYRNKETEGYTKAIGKDGKEHIIKVKRPANSFAATEQEMSRIKAIMYNRKPERQSGNVLKSNAKVLSEFHKANNPVIKETSTPKVEPKKTTTPKKTTNKKATSKKTTKVKANTKKIKW